MNATPIAIAGGGIAGLALALHLHARGLSCEVFEAVSEVRELGVGITLLPHAMRELAALGLQARIEAAGIENYESAFYNRYGQFIYKELRGRHAGYALPEVGIHRGKLHRILLEAALERMGSERIHLGHRVAGMGQRPDGVDVMFESAAGHDRATWRAGILVACDGINSAVRKTFYPSEKLCFTGINTWRGVTRHQPILSGKTYLRVGSISTGKMVIYPIIDRADGSDLQLINWMAEIQQEGESPNDWNQGGRLQDVLPIYKDWRFDWLDVAALISNADQILQYPMVDKDPIAQWTFGAVTLMGDAAHPMYPRGSNGSAQALIDARTLADELAARQHLTDAHEARLQALHAYEAKRRPATTQIVLTNRSHPPDFINSHVDELSGGKPFRHIDDVISQDKLRQFSEDYKRIAGFSKEALTAGSQAV
jgi:5-methylphenazine-1-carboxylate 1-monooxygenase